ncbi:MAG TPA: carboxymuconolactone decarboxylase family protein [Baekduia sp.]
MSHDTAAPGPRIAPVTDPDEDLASRLTAVPSDAAGRPLNLFATLAHRPRLLTQLNALGGRLMFDGVLADRERELVILRIAAHTGCTYEIRAHRALAATAGLDGDEIAAALDPGTGRAWPAGDAALLGVVDDLAAGADVSDPSWAALDGVLDDDAGRVELLVLVGFYRMLAGVLNGARVEADDVVAGPHGRLGAAPDRG